MLQAEEMAMTFRQRIAQAEAMARADMLRFSPEVLTYLSVHGLRVRGLCNWLKWVWAERITFNTVWVTLDPFD